MLLIIIWPKICSISSISHKRPDLYLPFLVICALLSRTAWKARWTNAKNSSRRQLRIKRRNSQHVQKTTWPSMEQWIVGHCVKLRLAARSLSAKHTLMNWFHSCIKSGESSSVFSTSPLDSRMFQHFVCKRLWKKGCRASRVLSCWHQCDRNGWGRTEKEKQDHG